MSFAGQPVVFDGGPHVDESLEQVHAGPAVFAIHTDSDAPYLGKTSLLRRRLRRLLRPAQSTSRLLNLRSLARRVEYWPTGSQLEASLVLYELARKHLPHRYTEFLKLRMPPYVRLTLGSPWPRTQVTTRPSGSGQFFGPFRSRAAAEAFDHDALDLFQIRRCQEDLVPTPEHPGCIYGEMGMCLRPCQTAVTEAEYASEVKRVSEFLQTGGRVALQTAEAARDRLSSELEFEAAAQQHKRVERIQSLIRTRDDLARDVDTLYGLAVLPSARPGEVVLWMLSFGFWQRPLTFEVITGSQSESVDARLRQALIGCDTQRGTPRERTEHLAILSRWYYSGWRDGMWIDLEPEGRFPYRRVVSAVSRTVHQSFPTASH